MVLLEFHLNSLKLLYLLFLPFMNMFNDSLTLYMKFLNSIINHGSVPDYHPLLVTLTVCLGEIFCIVIEFIKRKVSKKNKLSLKEATLLKKSNEEESEEEHNQKKKMKVQTQDILIIVFIAIIDFVVVSFLLIGKTKNIFEMSMIMKLSQIICLGILSQYFLSISLYRHHIISLCVIGLGLIGNFLLTICFSIGRKEKTSTYILNIFLLFGLFFLNSIKYIAEKYLIDKRYYSPYLIIFFNGCIGILLTLITQGIVIFQKCEMEEVTYFCQMTQDKSKIIDNLFEGFLDYINDSSQHIYLLFLLFVFFCSIAINCFTGIIIQDFNPTYLGIGDSLGLMLVWIGINIFYYKSGLSKSPSELFIVTLIGTIIFGLVILSCLIFTELIILDCFGLKYYTKREIIRRAEDEIGRTNGILNMSEIDQDDKNNEVEIEEENNY